MTRRKPIMPKNWHCWTFSTDCGTNKVSKPPPTISAVTNKLQKLIFRISAKKRKYSFPTYKTKRNRLLSPSWKHRKSRFPLARHWWTASSQAAIRQTPPSCRRCGTSANWPYWKGCWKHLRWTSIKRISRSIRTANLSLKSTLRRTNGFIRS